MKVIVIGSGLAGVTAAWYLNQNDCEVIVLDRAAGPALETSFANGSLITAGLTNPWNSPGVFGQLIKTIGREDSPMLLRPRAIAGMLRWGTAFLRNSTPQRFEQAWLRNVRFAQYSQRVMAALLQNEPLQFDHARRGTLSVQRNRAGMDEAEKTAEFLKQVDVPHQLLSVDQLLELQPALAPIREELSGAVHYPDDEVGDAHKFCEELCRVSERRGVDFRFGEAVAQLVKHGDRVDGVVTANGTLTADAYVLAAGAYSVGLAKPLGLRLPIRPVKGYSITVPTSGWPQRPQYPVLDSELHAVLTPVGDRLRVAGTAEFAGFDTTISSPRVTHIRSLLRKTYPQFEAQLSDAEVTPWTGLRPMTPESYPILGRSPISNLFLNTGHGAQGWTMACGSGKLVADIVCGREPDVALDGLRFRQ